MCVGETLGTQECIQATCNVDQLLKSSQIQRMVQTLSLEVTDSPEMAANSLGASRNCSRVVFARFATARKSPTPKPKLMMPIRDNSESKRDSTPGMKS